MKTQVVLIVCLLALVLFSAGCSGFWDQPGKTAQEVNRDHYRILRINNQQMMRDLDRWLGFDKPSMLTEMKIP